MSTEPATITVPPTATIAANPSPSAAPAAPSSPAVATGPDLGFLDTALPKGWAKAAGYPEAWETKFTTLKPLLGSSASAEKLIGAKGIIKPGPNATPQEVEHYYSQLGRPATAKDYALAKPEKITIAGKETAVPAEVWDQAFADEASSWFHELGLSKEQGAKLNERFLARTMGARGNVEAMIQQHREATKTTLKSEWGSNFESNVQLAKDAALKAGMTMEQITDPAFGDNPALLKVLANVGKMIVETPAANARGNSAVTTNPAAKIAAIYADKNHPWHPHHAKTNPVGHKAAVEEMQQLYKAKHGETA